MVETVQILVLLLAVVAAVAVVAARLEIPPAILLVIAGVILALIPGLPSVELAPELVLLLVLPPVIYSAAVSMSWNEFRFNLRPISLLAVGCVVFTTVAVAAGNRLAPRLAVAGGFRAGRDRLTAGRRGAAVDPAQDAASPAYPGRARRGSERPCALARHGGVLAPAADFGEIVSANGARRLAVAPPECSGHRPVAVVADTGRLVRSGP